MFINNTFCTTCGTKFHVRPSKLVFKHKFCSIKCYGIWQSTQIGKINPRWHRVEVVCKQCNNKFFVYSCKINKKGQAQFCSKKCHDISQNKKVKHICITCGKEFITSPSSRRSKNKFCNNKCKGMWWSKQIIGRNHHNWKGTTPIDKTIRTSEKYLNWRKSIFERDNYTCQKCGNNKSGKLNAHHKKRFSVILNDIKQRFPLLSIIDIVKDYPDMWDIKNGITLCKDCHKLEHIRKKG